VRGALASRGHTGRASINGEPFTLKLTNQLFAQTGYALEQPFLDLLAQQYGAGVKLLDFAARPEASRLAINGFIDFHTEKLIPELIPDGAITSSTRVVLANAVYLNAAWATRFDAAQTRNAAFTLSNGSSVQVPTMRLDEVTARTATVNGVEAIELPTRSSASRCTFKSTCPARRSTCASGSGWRRSQETASRGSERARADAGAPKLKSSFVGAIASPRFSRLVSTSTS
jgi:hypothetical protein